MKKTRRLRWILFACIIASLVLIGVLDFNTGRDVSLSLLYLVPVSLAVLLGGNKGGIVCSIVASAIFMTSELKNGAFWQYALWNSFMRLGVLLVVGVLLTLVIRRLSEALTDDSK